MVYVGKRGRFFPRKQRVCRGKRTGDTLVLPAPLLLAAAAVCIGIRKGLVQESMLLSDETARQTETVGEGPVRGAVRRIVIAAARVETQGRLVDLVHVQEHLLQFKFWCFSYV